MAKIPMKFKFGDLTAGIGDFVLVSNADSAEPDTESGCHVARILELYEDTTNTFPLRAKVQWYSRPNDIPKASLINHEPIEFLDREVLEDHRPFDTDVSIKTFFKKCSVSLRFTKDTDLNIKGCYNYICRYRLKPVTKKKVKIEPVLGDEPIRMPNIPTCVVKLVRCDAILEQNKNDKQKKVSPKKVTFKTPIIEPETPNSSGMQEENSDEESPVANMDVCLSDPPLPGREQELVEIIHFVRNQLLQGISGGMYISGAAGSGKTATVQAALDILREEADIPHFQLVQVNGMRVSEPRQAFGLIYRQLTGKSVAWEQACALLHQRFASDVPRKIPTVLVVDEIDAPDVLNNIFEWATHPLASLTVLAVANKVDRPETGLTARVGRVTRLAFPPYTNSQLQAIVDATLANATQIINRKMASVSGVCFRE